MTPEEFAQLQPGDDVIFIGNSNSFVTNGKSYKVVQKWIGTIRTISIVNDQGIVDFISDLDKISKQEKKYPSVFMIYYKDNKKPRLDEIFILLEDAVAFVDECYDEDLIVVEYIPTAIYSPPSAKDWIKESLTE